MPVKLRVGEVARQQGLTIKALAERAGVAYNTAHVLATGRATRIDLDTLDRICAALHVQPGDLFIRYPAQETGESGHDVGGSYAADPGRPAGAGH